MPRIIPSTMPRRSGANLEQRLSLLSWLQSRLAYGSTEKLLTDIKESDEGFDAEGRSYICTRLLSRAGRLNEITSDDLQRYDDNIREHLASMNAGRPQPITLRYFQYLAALCTEIFLDRRHSSPVALLDSINSFVDSLNSNRYPDEQVERFVDSDINKLAFWMATGSGKTLLMHLNYRQFMHYNRKSLDNILLITPYESLSQQHLDEMQVSGIFAERFSLNESGLFLNAPGVVKVTEISKLKMEKSGEGESIPVDAFEGNNLIFVDEGHKGTSREARSWRTVRDALGETGFTFEYSATFGQALTAAQNDDLTSEYGKAIAFDYSYRHFYGDGYGKDFSIVNLREETTEGQTDLLLLANMLTFYEQHLAFTEHADDLRPYNLDRPLWVFVGSRVNAVSNIGGQPQSDVLTIINFLHRFMSNASWATQAIGQLLKGQSRLLDELGHDIFADKFSYLRRLGMVASAVHADILERVLHAPSGGTLHVCDIRGADGELGLKVGGAENYFGVINIGDTPKFKRLVQDNRSGIVVEDDGFSGSLFDRINELNTTVEVLIGSKKFIEGWSSWRVSNMGLLNIGTSEGSQIIQLFGRGVRLRGREMSLKRSSALNGPHPDNIRLLETLNIFAIRANYMSQFRDYIKREGITTESMFDLPLHIQPNRRFLNKGLVVPRLQEGHNFKACTEVLLELDSQVSVVVNMSARVQTMTSGGGEDGIASSGEEINIPPESLDLVDWGAAYLSLLQHRERKGMDNLLIHSEALRQIMESDLPVYNLIAEKSVVEPKTIDDLDRLQETVLNILRKYADALYRRRRNQWESNNLVYKPLDEQDPNFAFNNDGDGVTGRHIVSVPVSQPELIRQIEQLIADCNALYHSDEGMLPRVHFDRHLYHPLLVDKDDKIMMSPPGLNPGEARFVNDLKEYWTAAQDELPVGFEVFLLRNQGRGAGIGFFDNSGFYPDFILWVKSDDWQRIVFVEPHGMIHAPAYVDDYKARLHERLPELARAMSERSCTRNVQLDSFIVSQTAYPDLKSRYESGKWCREDFTKAHILFPERNVDYDYLAEIMKIDATCKD